MINEEEHQLPPRKRKDDSATGVTVEEMTPEQTAEAEQRWARQTADEAQAQIPLKADEIQHVNTPPTEPADQSDTPTPEQLGTASLAGMLGDLKAVKERQDAAEAAWTTLTESINRTSLFLHERLSKLEMAKPSPAAIYGAIWLIMNDVQGVGKHGRMDPKAGMGNYQFRRYDDLKRELGAACRAHGVMLQSEIVNVTSEHPFKDERKTRVQVHTRYRFTSLTDGSSVVFEALGESIDTSDKATGKAQTMALKTALDQAFMLAMEDIEDPDATRPNEDDAPPERPRREPHPTAADLAAAQRVAQEYQVGDTVTVAGQTFVKHSDGPGFPNDQPQDTTNPWDQGPPPDNRTNEQKAQAAANKLSAPGITMAEWSRISDAARQMGLYEVPVTVNGQEMALKHHLVAVGRTLA